MLLFDNKKQKFLNVLKLTGSPFRKFVSTGEINEELGVVQSRKGILQSIINKIESNESFILPIIGNVGSGKTHLYWALRHILHHFNVVYISLDIIYETHLNDDMVTVSESCMSSQTRQDGYASGSFIKEASSFTPC